MFTLGDIFAKVELPFKNKSIAILIAIGIDWVKV